MRRFLFLAVLVFALTAARPASAQLRSQVPESERAPTQVLDEDATSFSLNSLFNPADFQMDHSYTMSAGTFGGSGYSYGLYTNTMRWQPTDNVAARVDVGFMHSPFGALSGETNGLNGQLFLQNAEIAYRPADNVELHFVVRQNPYGNYMQPQGYVPYGYAGGFDAFERTAHRPLFWKNR